MSEWYDKTQGATLALAENRCERWSVEDLDIVVAFTDEASDAELAFTTGRTLAAIWTIQNRIRHEGVEGVRADVIAAQGRVVAREKGYTFIGDDVPPGWL